MKPAAWVSCSQYPPPAFEAMKQVEIPVRELARADAGHIGVPLMRQVYASNWLAVRSESKAGEQEATPALFAGGYEHFQEPNRHREVELNDPTEASRVVLLATCCFGHSTVEPGRWQGPS